MINKEAKLDSRPFSSASWDWILTKFLDAKAIVSGFETSKPFDLR